MSRRPPPRVAPGSQIGSIGSFRAGSPLPTTLSRGPSRSILRRLSTQYHYQTFPTPPPRSSGRRRAGSGTGTESPGSYRERRGGSNGNGDGGDNGGSQDREATPLPLKQLALLAVLSLAEQTALNSISPYLPEMIETFPGVAPHQVGLYVGLLASAFALAQLLTNLIWGYLSDIIGRKPVLLTGTTLLCLCFTAFGFCSKYWHVVLVHIAMGLLNGNAAVVPTCLGELTDRTNQSRAFIWLPVVYSLGSITGPALGGLLVGRIAPERFPYLAPNILSAGLLAIAVVVLVLWFEETLDEQGDGYEAPEVLDWLRTWLDRSKKSKGEHDAEDYDGDGERPQDREDSALLGHNDVEGQHANQNGEDDDDDDHKFSADSETWKELFNRTTVVLLLTFLVFQLSNSSFNSLYPIFASGDPPTGRGLKASVIGVSLSVAGFFTILFQLFAFGPLKSRLGNVGTYRASLLGFAISMALMPFIGYQDGEPPFGFGRSNYWLYVEAGVILVVKNICAVGGLSSAMLLVTNSAPSHSSLGTLNGIAQTLSAAGRSVGPFLSGALFSLSTNLDTKGEVLAWGLFAGISLAGWVSSFAIKGAGLESTDDGYGDGDSDDDDDVGGGGGEGRDEERG